MKCIHLYSKAAVFCLIYWLFLTAIVCPVQGQDSNTKAFVEGQVVDEEGEPLYLAHVMVKGTTIGDATDNNGEFRFEISAPDAVTVVVSMVGYAPVEKEATLSTGETMELNFQLSRQNTSLDEATVTAGAFTTGDAEGVTLSPMEVITTPGAAADIFRSLQTFPGVSNVDEGSGLFVRGGDVSEVSFILDQASVVHPYKYESPTGGVFGTIPPFLVSGTSFYTGGFSAKYGNAMSAVLAMESKGMPDGAQFDANIGMAALSARGGIPVLSDKLGVRFSGNRSLTRFMFDVNGVADEFQQAPMGGDGNLSVIAKPYKGTTIKLFNYMNTSRLGVRVPQPSFEGTYRGEEQNRLHNLQWKQLWGDWFLMTSFSMNRYKNNRQLGILDLIEEDRTYKWRSDIEFNGWENVTWYGGMEWMYVGDLFSGQVPGDQDLLDPSADFQFIDEEKSTQRLGGYIESEYQLLSHVQLRLGVRTDYENRSDDWTVDPRMSLQYQPAGHSSIRLATGRYHQYADPYQYNSATGNEDLKAQQSWHYIAAYEFKKDLFHIRTEGYYKSYDDLIIEDEQQNFSNDGYGEAYGTDFFFKYSDYLRTPFNGWISYSLLRSKRLQPRQTVDGIKHSYAPSAFDITHNLNVVAKGRLIGMLSGGVTHRYSTGRPFIPIISAEPTSEKFFIPIEGEVHSQRLPNFQRVDLNFSYYWVPAQNWSVIFYTSVSNLLDRDNVMEYTYNNDYSDRIPIYSNYNRFVYAGATVNVEL